MRKEIKVLILSMIANIIISISKIISGFVLNISSLFSDGLHTFIDFISDILSLIGIKLAKKRSTKYHPFGFGKVEYLMNLFVGIILFLLATFIVIYSFNKKTEVPSLSLLWILLILFVLKFIVVLYILIVGNKVHSQVLITAEQSAKTDLYSSFGVILITFLLQFSDKLPVFIYSDLIGSILISLLIYHISIKLIIHNSMALLGEIETNEEKINNVLTQLKEFKEIKESKIILIKYGYYYELMLELELNSKLNLRKVSNLTRKIKRKITWQKDLYVRYVTIYVTNNLNK